MIQLHYNNNNIPDNLIVETLELSLDKCIEFEYFDD